MNKIKNIVDYERVLAAHQGDGELLHEAKHMGFSDKFIAQAVGRDRRGNLRNTACDGDFSRSTR